MITLKRLSKHYYQGQEKIEVLENISTQFSAGDRVAILGPSGSGKTTLLSVMAAFEKPSSGTVLFDQKNIHELSPDELQRFRQEKIGFIFQRFELISALTVLENVMLPLEITKKYSPTECEKKAKKMLEKVGLGHRLNFYPSQISGGESQRVAVARALVHQPTYIFADEPTGNLDEKNSQKITTLLLDSITEDQILFVITHDPNVAKQMAKTRSITNKKLK